MSPPDGTAVAGTLTITGDGTHSIAVELTVAGPPASTQSATTITLGGSGSTGDSWTVDEGNGPQTETGNSRSVIAAALQSDLNGGGFVVALQFGEHIAEIVVRLDRMRVLPGTGAQQPDGVVEPVLLRMQQTEIVKAIEVGFVDL